MIRPENVLLFVALVVPSHSEGAVVATSHSAATKAARDVLARGGNAFDAACAATFALGVAQPYFTGIGGGGLALVSPAKGPVEFLDFREQAPLAVHEKHFYKNGKPSDPSAVGTGAWSVGLPGNVAGCGEIVEKWGKLGWKQVLDPAIKLAVNGVEISQLFQEEIAEQLPRFNANLPGMNATFALFGGPDAKGLKKGEVLKQPALAETLRRIAEGGFGEFYSGELSRRWLMEAKEGGVTIREDELRNYRVVRTSPVAFEVGTFAGLTANRPSQAAEKIGGVLKYIHTKEPKTGRPGPLSVERYILQIEAQLAAIKAGKVERSQGKKHTAHVSVVDDEGSAAAVTSSVGEVFASGITLGKHGFLLNDTLSDFEIKAGHPNSPRGGQRPLSNMSPTLLYQGARAPENLVAVVGAAGGPLIPQAVTMFIKNYFDYGMSAGEAIRFPRVAVSSKGGISLEKSAPRVLVDGLKKAGYKVELTDTIWAVFQGAVRRSPQAAWEAVSESRYDGEAWTGPSR